MSLALPLPLPLSPSALRHRAGPVPQHASLGRQQQQQDEADADSDGDGDGTSGAGTVGSSGRGPSAFALQLPTASSPDGPRQATLVHLHQLASPLDQLKSLGAPRGDHASPHRQLHLEIQRLQDALVALRVEKDREIAQLSERLAHALAQTPTLPNGTGTCQAPPRLVPWMHSITERGEVTTSRLGRHASLRTQRVLADAAAATSLVASGAMGVAARVVAALTRDPALALPYLHSAQFGADVVELSAAVGAVLEAEPRCLALASPVHVLGDVHGNWGDLRFFAEQLWPRGLGLAAGAFLFLGDYVDRGSAGLECAAYLFALKLLHPHKLFLLRGNHETRAVNGHEAHYGRGAFLAQCRARFGWDEGCVVWHQVNHAFDRLPVAATIDDAVFCVHGGIPRPPGPFASTSALEAIRRLPPVLALDDAPGKRRPADVDAPATAGDHHHRRLLSDLLWGDPARDDDHEPPALDPLTGFGPSRQRGGEAVSFGTRAVDAFLGAHGLTCILRAHEAAVDGVHVAMAARVLTIFSTSADHGLGDDATCGCVLVERDRLTALNRAASHGRRHQLTRRRSVAAPTAVAALAASSSRALGPLRPRQQPSSSPPPPPPPPRRQGRRRRRGQAGEEDEEDRESGDDGADSTDDETEPTPMTSLRRPALAPPSSSSEPAAGGEGNNQADEDVGRLRVGGG